MDRYGGSLLKDAGEMKRRCVDHAGNFFKRDAFSQSTREVNLDCFHTLGVICIRPITAAFPRQAMSSKRRFQHIGDELNCGDIGPEMFERIDFGCLQTLDEFAMSPENV
jgi:hypothetical protein